MELLICQSCGVVLRSAGKHCTGCGIPLAMHTPTPLPLFKQTRPPLSVSVQRDHLLLEKVVTARQLAALSITPSYGSSSTYEHDYAQGGNGGNGDNGPSSYGGNGGNGSGNGDNGGSVASSQAPAQSWTQGSIQHYAQPPAPPSELDEPADNSVETPPKARQPALPAQQPAQPQPGQAQPSGPQPPAEDSKTLNEFGKLELEERKSSGEKPSLMASFASKGLLKEKKDEEDTTSETPAVGSDADWGSDAEPAGESQAVSTPDQTKQEQTETSALSVAQGIGGAAISIAIGNAINGFVSSAASPPKTDASAQPADTSQEQPAHGPVESQEQPPEVAVESSQPSSNQENAHSPQPEPGASAAATPAPVQEVAPAADPQEQTGAHLTEEEAQALAQMAEQDGPEVKASAESPEPPGEIKDINDLPKEVVPPKKVFVSEEMSPATSPENQAIEPQQSPDSQPTPVQEQTSQQEPEQPVSEDKEPEPSRQPKKPANFDFASQFGTDFNPEDYFNGVTQQLDAYDPEEDEEAEAPAQELQAPAQPAAPAPVADPTPASTSPEPVGGARKEVMDFFGGEPGQAGDPNQSASQTPIASQPTEDAPAAPAAPVAPALNPIGGGAQSAPQDNFDFFDTSPNLTREAEQAQTSQHPEFKESPRTSLVSTPDLEDDEDDDESSAERPKVAMPRSITGGHKLVEDDEETPPVDGDEDEEEDEEEDEVTTSRPKRRSFSGNSIKPKSVSKKKKSDEEDEEFEDDEEDEEDDDSPGGALEWLEAEVTLGSLHVNRKTAIVLCAVGGFILIQIPGWIMAFVSPLTGGGGAPPQVAQQAPRPGMAPAGMPRGVPNQPRGGLAGIRSLRGGGQPQQMLQPRMPQQQMPQPGVAGAGASTGVPVVAGVWDITMIAGRKPYPGKIVVQQQSGMQFAGLGRDASGMFNIQGQLIPPDQVKLVKQYDKDSVRKFKAIKDPINMIGRMRKEANGLFVINQGRYETMVRKGFESSINNPLRMVKVAGAFNAKQIKQTAPVGNQVASASGESFWSKLNPLNLLKPKPANAAKIKTGPQAMQDMFLMIAGVLVLIGICIFLFFLMLFGPQGKMNIWEKQKYIPSQFKREHMKMVREMGKPLQAGAAPFGKRLEWHWWCFWTPKFLCLPPELRKTNPHILLLGSAAKGKSRLMAKMITHDIEMNDRAIVVIDSDGRLADLVVQWIATRPNGMEFAKRVVMVDPTYRGGSLAYNPLEMPEDGDLQSAASAIVHGFKAIYNEAPGQQNQSQWNAQTANILRNAALLLMANGRTLTDLPALLQDNDFRDIMLETIERRKDEKTEYISIMETWNQYKKLARTDQWINWVEPILNRVGPMLGDGRIRPILTKPVSDLKLRDIITEKKILIVKVPQGELDQNANLLGSLIVTGLQQSAMSLCRDMPHAERPVALYLDEMDDFIEKETVENIASETQRFQIGFCGSIKTLQHLPEDYRSQLIINMGTMAIFALAKKDGDMLGPQMFRVDGRKIKHQTIQNFFNKVNTSPQFELIMDEEKLNIDRIVGQEIQTFFCYRVGTVAGVFKLKAYDFKDLNKDKIDQNLIEEMHALKVSEGKSGKKKKSA